VPVIRRDIGEHIHTNGVFKITGIEIREMVGPFWRNVMQQFFSKIPVRVNNANPMPHRNVLDDEIPQEGSLAGARLSDDIYVLSLVLFGYAKTLGVTPAVAFSNNDAGF
jgi:hypothetical protein